MAKYPCRLISSFLLYSAAFCIIFIMTLLNGWYIIRGGYAFHFSGRYDYSYYQYSYYGTNSYYDTYYRQSFGDGSGLSTAIYILLFVSVGFTGLCVLLSFIMMCADCCCRITKCMTVIPKITTGFGQMAGMLAEAACVVFLVKIYASLPPKDSLGDRIPVIPYYCFYLVGVAGILLMIAGCINCGVKHATRVEDSGAIVHVEQANSQSAQQQQQQQMQMMYTGGINPAAGMPYYQPPQMAFGHPAYYPGNNGLYPQSQMFTQAS
ncbi:hypothetical protein Btru_047154 [Bulinus truncatus]|nr:hypothetical protein Btru_047154 [Bulinus truncatus]